jgi:phage N-6-adenine-methyltransferase
MKGQDVLFSHKSDNYITPKWLIDELKQEFDIKLDACTTPDNPMNTKWFITPPTDGLKYPWLTWTYCNPPYSQVEQWASKAYNENIFHSKKSIMLLPVRTDTKWFHDYIYNKNNVEIRFLKGRLKFQGTNNSAPFPSMLVIFL